MKPLYFLVYNEVLEAYKGFGVFHVVIHSAFRQIISSSYVSSQEAQKTYQVVLVSFHTTDSHTSLSPLLLAL